MGSLTKMRGLIIALYFAFYFDLISSQDIILTDTCNCLGKTSFEWNCGMYYECANNGLWLRHCAADLQFNETLQMCVFPSDSSCNENSICPASTTTTSTTASTTPKPRCNNPDCFEQKCNLDPMPDVMEYANCSSTYYYCTHGNAADTCFCPTNCSQNLIFDSSATTMADKCCRNAYEVPGCDNYKDMNARLKYDRREFNRPMCYMDESGECSDEPISTSCEKSEFTYCLNGWTCHYYCTGERQVYNSRDNLCQDLQSCHKSMRYDL